jgi:hypothetical protein
MALATKPIYQPSPLTVPMTTPDGRILALYLQQQLQLIAQALGQTPLIFLQPINAAPPRPRVGMIAFADGTNWNPGSGAGLYVYKSGGWTFIV